MSKVIKGSEDFVPERIVPEQVDQPAVWEQLAKQVKIEPPEKKEETPPNGADADKYESAPDPNQEETDSYDFDNDFSSPQQQEEDDAIDNQLIEETKPESPAPVDLEALAEEYFNKGVQSGIERVESDYNLSIKTLQSVCEQLNTIRETILKNSLQEMQDLVLQISEKIIRHSVENQEQTIIKTVEDAIQKAVKSDEFIIYLNPNDLKTIQTRSSDFINSINGLENIVVKVDEEIDRGGCLVESSNCTVDATLASQIQIISDAFKQK